MRCLTFMVFTISNTFTTVYRPANERIFLDNSPIFTIGIFIAGSDSGY